MVNEKVLDDFEKTLTQSRLQHVPVMDGLLREVLLALLQVVPTTTRKHPAWKNNTKFLIGQLAS